jgi:NAD(P)-dependent dehydrogenase (short-subunit alcohol dehydrogenase family)
MTRTIVITGASDGIGAASARQLHEAGEQVIVVGRDPGKTARVANELGVPFHVADFAELDQVRTLAADLLDAYPRIDVLANNAGGVFRERRVTVDGFELTFQVNHLAGFLLTHLLRARLLESAASVIQTSSFASRFARLDLDDLQGERAYSASRAYANSKLANVLFTRELHRRDAEAGLAAVAFHPGAIASSFGSASTRWWKLAYTNPWAERFLESTEVGGSRLTWLALGKPGFDWEPGEYYARNRVARTSSAARDPRIARVLWERSATLLGVDQG